MLDWEGKRLGVGPARSGSHVLAESLLTSAGLSEKNQLLEANEPEQLALGRLDAIFLVASPNAPAVRQMLADSRLQLVSFRRAEGYTRHLRYLSHLRLVEGAVDLSGNLPGRDVELLAPAATLVVSKRFHPALTGVLLGAATEIHQDPGPLHQRGDFPSPDFGSFPLTREAEFFHKNGPSFLQGRVPYKVAATLERLLILLLPFLTVILPLAKILPAIYAWRMKNKIYKPYKELLALENQTDRPDFVERLDRLEQEAKELLAMPPAYGSEVANLLLHVERLRNRFTASS
ncbi:MAG: hypothetical protein KDI54_18805 [Gammaproteobacteria bacterium]|nr:hypothetical protein [Gammaproteobacteria bacterium]